jgi:hypothetical protein
MKTLKEIKKSVVWTFARCNPPTLGHSKLIECILEEAKTRNIPHVVFLSEKMDEDNPLSVEERIAFLSEVFPNAVFRSSKTLFTAAKEISESYGKSTLVVGEDRMDMADKGVATNTICCGSRNMLSEGVEGVSATDAREAVRQRDYQTFAALVEPQIAERLYERVSSVLNEGVYDRGIFKAIFIGADPTADKMLILPKLGVPTTEVPLELLYGMMTVNEAVAPNLDQISKDIARGKKVNSDDTPRVALLGRKPLLIPVDKGTDDQISLVKSTLEEIGYDTMMIYVRNTSGKRPSVPDTQKTKETSDFDSTRRMFVRNFYVVDAKYNTPNATPEERKELNAQIEKVTTNVSRFFEKPVRNTLARKWVARSIADDENGTGQAGQKGTK